MAKYMGLGLVLVGCTAMGIAAGKDMDRRVRDLRELIKLLQLLEGEIGYANAVLSEGFRHAARRMRMPYGRFLEKMADHMDELRGEGLKDIFEGCIREELNHTALTREDKEALAGFGAQLGNLDVKMQLGAIALYREQLLQAYGQAQEMWRKDAKLYRYLGVMGGLFLTVIFL